MASAVRVEVEGAGVCAEDNMALPAKEISMTYEHSLLVVFIIQKVAGFAAP